MKGILDIFCMVAPVQSGGMSELCLYVALVSAVRTVVCRQCGGCTMLSY
jgi:hypothetical protein